MDKFICKNHDALSEYVSEKMIDLVEKQQHSTFILASGNTPTLAYQLFSKKFLNKKIDKEKITIILLDEWHGLPFGHPSSCYTYIKNNIIDPLSIPTEQFIYWDSACRDTEAECKKMQKYLDKIKVDMSVLGVGVNGHIGFNEPSDVFVLGTHYTLLSHDSYNHPMAQPYKNQIKGGMTLGIQNLFKSKNILLLASGYKKKEIIHSFMKENIISSRLPLSILHLHPSLYFVADEECVNYA